MTKAARFGAILLSIASLAAGSWLASAHAQPMNPLPKKTVPLTPGEVRAIYADKTWTWSTGGGRFISKGRKFIAYSEKDGLSTIAEGRWTVETGRLCMVAVWVTKLGKAPKTSCFQLVRDRGTIYQRREPKGNWFILRTFKPKPNDELNKFVTEDTVTPNIQRLKTALEQHTAEGG